MNYVLADNAMSRPRACDEKTVIRSSESLTNDAILYLKQERLAFYPLSLNYLPGYKLGFIPRTISGVCDIHLENGQVRLTFKMQGSNASFKEDEWHTNRRREKGP